MRWILLVTLLTVSALTGAALAFDNGQYENVPADIRAWFKGVVAPNGVPCCDISDGHRTEYDFHEGAYWVPIEGQWMQVPAHAIIRDRGNPVGEAVVWYVHHRGSIIISCLFPAEAVGVPHSLMEAAALPQIFYTPANVFFHFAARSLHY